MLHIMLECSVLQQNDTGVHKSCVALQALQVNLHCISQREGGQIRQYIMSRAKGTPMHFALI